MGGWEAWQSWLFSWAQGLQGPITCQARGDTAHMAVVGPHASGTAEAGLASTLWPSFLHPARWQRPRSLRSCCP